MVRSRFSVVAGRLRRTVEVVLLVLLAVVVSLSAVSAHYKDAKLEIPKAITIPVIDGTYNMTLNRVQIAGQERLVDEWNDAAWIEVPRNTGNMTAYSGYKYDGEFLYMAHDLVSVTESSFNKRSSAGTAFDPLHNGGAVAARPDDFIVLPIWGGEGGEEFHMYLRYGQSDGNYGYSQPIPEGTGFIANSAMTTSPFSSTPHLFYEVQVPLTVGNLYKHIDSTIGIFQEAYNVSPSGEKSDNWYPMAGDIPAVDNYADAVFSKTINPSMTVPPTVAQGTTASTVSTTSTTLTATMISLTTTSTAGAQFYLRVVSPFGQTDGDGQYNVGDKATFSVSPTRITGVGPFIDAVFVGWTGASTSNEATATVIMDSDKTVTAVWAYDYGGVYFISMIVGLAAAACLALVIVRRRRRET
jgi:hypothetical protein